MKNEEMKMIHNKYAAEVLKRIRSRKPGARVRILRQDIFYLKHRKNRNGVITHVDGSYISVRPMWCDWEIELYPNEIEVL